MTFFQELKRRNVFRLAIAYLAVSWLLIQIVETIFPVFGLSDALVRIIIIVLAIGFPIVLILAWLYELTPEGLKLDKDVDRSNVQEHYTGKKLDRAIMVVLVLSLAYFAVDKFVLDPARDARLVETAVERGRTAALVDAFGESSIAVLPFVNMSSDAEQEYFSDGISEELLNLLAKVRNLRVISRSSSFSYKGKEIDIPTIAAEMNVAHILEGSVRKSGNKIRITAQLIDARSDTHLWSETYDRELDDIFTIQDEISAAIVSELKEKLELEDGAAPRATATASNEAHEAYLRGRYQSLRGSTSSKKIAVREFKKAVEIDPDYALAHAELGKALIAYHRMTQVGVREEVFAEAALHIDLALQLDPMLAEVQAAKGYLIFRNPSAESDIYESTRYLERALELNPSYAFAMVMLARNYQITGEKFGKSFALNEKAAQVDPLSSSALASVVAGLVVMGRLDEADVVLEKLASINASSHAAFKGFRLGVGGNHSERFFGELNVRRLDPESVLNVAALQNSLSIIGLADEALAVFDEAYPANLETLRILGRYSEAVVIAEAHYAEDADSPDNLFILHEMQGFAGIYSPEILASWQEWWDASVTKGNMYDRIGMIGLRRAAGKSDDEYLLTMKNTAAHSAEAGIKYYGDGHMQLGMAKFLEGHQEEGLAIVRREVENGGHFNMNVGFMQEFYEHPDFAPIQAIQDAMQEREREKLLTIVCNNNPYEAVWQPQPGTCEAFAAEQEN
jgi:adenylate cyclase